MTHCSAAPDRADQDASALPLHADTVIRPAAQHDFEAVMDAYWKEWGVLEDRSRAVAGYWTAKIFEKATFGHLAWQGRELTGLVFGHACGADCIPLNLWRPSSNWAAEALAADPGALELLSTIEAANGVLRKEASDGGSRYMAELDFLWVSSRARGQGLSHKLLLNAAHHSMRAQGVRTYALFTDNHCSVDFYCRTPWILKGRLRWNELPGLNPLAFPQEAESFMFERHI